MKHRPRVYIAGPYTKPDPCANTKRAIEVADELWAAGFVPFCPHLSHLWQTVSPHTYEFWLEYDMQWLYACDAVLLLPGASEGAEREVNQAVEGGIPVSLTIDGLLSVLAEKLGAD